MTEKEAIELEEKLAQQHGSVINAMTKEQKAAVRWWGLMMASHMFAQFEACEASNGEWDFEETWEALLADME